MRAPRNRRVFVVGYAVTTPLGRTLATTWERAARGEAGFRRIALDANGRTDWIVGALPDWDAADLDFADARDVKNWNARFVHLSMSVCRDALRDAGLDVSDGLSERTGCLIGSSLNGHDAYREAAFNLIERGPNRVSPFLLPNLCANVPAGKAGMLLGFKGPVFSPQGACASGNYALGMGARMIRDGDVDLVLAGGVDSALLPEILHGFANMNATFKPGPDDRALDDPGKASRPFSVDRRGFVLSEGAGVLVLAADEVVASHGLRPRAEVAGVGWTSDAYHVTKPHGPSVVRAMQDAIADAGLAPADIGYVNAHGTSTPKGDANEVACLREVFGPGLARIPVSSNKSQIGHTLGAAAAVEAALTIEGLRRGIVLPTINYVADPELEGLDVVPNEARKNACEFALSNAFGFGGTNCCVVFRGA